MTTKSKIVLGLIGAAAAGVAAGLLMAPEKGSDIRKKIKKSAQDWANQFADFVSAGQDQLRNMASKGSDMANDLASEAGNAAKRAKEKM